MLDTNCLLEAFETVSIHGAPLPIRPESLEKANPVSRDLLQWRSRFGGYGFRWNDCFEAIVARAVPQSLQRQLQSA